MSALDHTAARPTDDPGAPAIATRVLVAEDDPTQGSLIELELTAAGYLVSRTATGRAAIAAIGAQAPDVVLVNAQLPDIDGLTVCREIRRDGCDAPVIMLTAQDRVGDRVIGLDSGADAVIVTPVVIEELLARMRVVVRRTADSRWIVSGRVRLQTGTREVLVGGQRVELSAQEFDLLAFLMIARGRAFTRREIYEGVWGRDYPNRTKAVDLAISALRKKLNAPGDSVIRTVRRVGYMARK